MWDRLPAHRSALVREFIALSQGHIETEYLPGYAPELNPVEYIWAYWKQHELLNVCPNDYWLSPSFTTRHAPTSMRRFSSAAKSALHRRLLENPYLQKTSLHYKMLPYIMRDSVGEAVST